MVYIFLDKQATIKVLSSTRISIVKQNRVHISWIPGHNGYDNEGAENWNSWLTRSSETENREESDLLENNQEDGGIKRAYGTPIGLCRKLRTTYQVQANINTGCHLLTIKGYIEISEHVSAKHLPRLDCRPRPEDIFRFTRISGVDWIWEWGPGYKINHRLQLRSWYHTISTLPMLP